MEGKKGGAKRKRGHWSKESAIMPPSKTEIRERDATVKISGLGLHLGKLGNGGTRSSDGKRYLAVRRTSSILEKTKNSSSERLAKQN